MKKSKKLLALALIPLMATTIGLTSCGSSEGGNGGDTQQKEKCTITWNVASQATVSVEGYEALPNEVEEGTSLVFTVEPKTGYEIDNVKLNNKRVTAKQGKYTVKISANAKIDITVKQQIEKIEVVKNPAKLKYFAGETLDLAGMEVKATYKTGESKVITQGADGYSVTPSVFEGGETEFKVLYEGQEVSVPLEDRVEYLVTIDVDGGTLSETYIKSLEALKLKNFKVEENGNVVFSYFKDLEGEILMPKAEDISKPLYEFLSWEGGVEKITASTAASVTLKAKFQMSLVDINKVYISSEEVEGVQTPFLNVEGFFGVADTVQLYLKEGNDNVEFNGEIYTGKQGDPFTCKFNIFDLQNAKTEDGQSFNGKWMDIRFAAEVNGEREEMEIFADGDYEVNPNQKVIIGNFIYSLANFENAVKVYYKESACLYTLEIKQEFIGETKKDVVVLKGNVKKEFAGKLAQISWYCNGTQSESAPYTSKIGASGEIEIKFPLQDFNVIKQNYFAHITIVESEEDGTVLFGGTNVNLDIGGCLTNLDPLPSKKGDIINALNGGFVSGIDERTYYVGNAWDGLMIYVVDVDYSFENVTLEKKEDGVYYTVNGKFESGNKNLKMNFYFDFQINSNLSDNGTWATVYKNYDLGEETPDQLFAATVNHEEKTFTYSFRVDNLFAEYDKTEKWTLTPHMALTRADSVGDLKAKEIKGEPIVFEGVKYSLRQDKETWNCSSLVLEKAE